MMQATPPALLETRSQVLHGQRVDVKVYGPGRAHGQCQRPMCVLCWHTRRDDPDRIPRWGDIDDIEKRWPVALGITAGVTPPISGRFERAAIICNFNPERYVQRFTPPPPPPPPTPTYPDFEECQQAAAWRLYSKYQATRAKCEPWTPKRRKAAGIATKRRNRQREAAEKRRAEKIAAYEASKRPCPPNMCDMGEWVKISHLQFKNLLGRAKTRFETGQVRGCDQCPRIEIQIQEAPRTGKFFDSTPNSPNPRRDKRTR